MNRPDLTRRATDLSEWMDAPDADDRQLRQTYAHFRVINLLVAGWWRVYTRHLRPWLAPDQPRTLLDIGCGGGDVPRALAAWAKRDGGQLSVTAIDADPRAIAYASSLPEQPGVQFRQALSSDLVRGGQRFDFVTSNHLLHHLSAAELQALLRDSEQLCRIEALHSDIERSAFAYAAYRAGTARFFPGSFIHQDGLLSIRRSYTHAELAALAPAGWQAARQWPSRNLLFYRARPHA